MPFKHGSCGECGFARRIGQNPGQPPAVNCRYDGEAHLLTYTCEMWTSREAPDREGVLADPLPFQPPNDEPDREGALFDAPPEPKPQPPPVVKEKPTLVPVRPVILAGEILERRKP